MIAMTMATFTWGRAGRGTGSGLPFAGGPGRGPRISRPVGSGPGRGYSDYAREGHAIKIKTHHLLFQTSNSCFFENRPLAAAASQHGGKGGLEGRILSARIRERRTEAPEIRDLCLLPSHRLAALE